MTGADADVIGLLVAASNHVNLPQGFSSFSIKKWISIVTKIDMADKEEQIEKASAAAESGWSQGKSLKYQRGIDRPGLSGSQTRDEKSNMVY